jgi:hypothetical protein
MYEFGSEKKGEEEEVNKLTLETSYLLRNLFD